MMKLRFYQGLYLKYVTYEISHGVFPDSCKVAKLKPFYKKGKKSDPYNHRPISLLPIISKLIERIAHNQTNNFLSENNVLYNFQLDLGQIFQQICIWHI